MTGNMGNLRRSVGLGCALATLTFILALGAQAQTEKVLYRFKNSPDGAYPQSGLVLRGGILYGTTGFGGTNNYGTVFELKNTAKGWAEKVLYRFTGGSDGGYPYGALTFDEAGNLYGTTVAGGILEPSCPAYGCGVVFELQPSATGWKETVLHSFTGGSDGFNPLADLVSDKQGNIYGGPAATTRIVLRRGMFSNYRPPVAAGPTA